MTDDTPTLGERIVIAATLRLTADQVPARPADAECWSNGDVAVYDHADCRWRYWRGKLIAFYRYRSQEERDRGVFPWSEMWTDGSY